MNLYWYLKTWDELTKDELYELFALRMKVFVVEQDCPYQDADGKDKESIHLFALTDDERCAACLRLVNPGISYDEWAIGRVATDPEHRSMGLGKELMKKGMDYLKIEKENPAIRISAQSHLQKFYEGFGFKKVGEEYMEDDIPHIEMLFQP